MNHADEAVIVDAVRSPIGKYGGALKDFRVDDLSALILRALVDRNNLDPAVVDDVIGDAQIRRARITGTWPAWLCCWLVFHTRFQAQPSTAFAAHPSKLSSRPRVLFGPVMPT